MTWSPNPDAFLADLEAKPAALQALARSLRKNDPWSSTDTSAVSRVVFLGMGSSRYAAIVCASRLRSRRIDAVAEYASATAVHPGGPGTLAVGISASGGSHETIAALERHRHAGSRTVAVTNAPGSRSAESADSLVEMEAGEERGGVACRTFQHTVALLLALEARLLHAGAGGVADHVERAAAATADLLDRREAWLPEVHDLLTATGSVYLIAPSERISSAEQGALMLREGPRLQADATETGDWAHVDVYLTKPLDYRALVFTGAAGDGEATRWLKERQARFVAVSGELDGASSCVRYPGDEIPEIALLTEVLVPELVASEHWRGAGS